MTQLEKDILIKTRPKFGSKRWLRLNSALGVAWSRCEYCGAMLFNPHSIFIHQGSRCQSLLNIEPNDERSVATEVDSSNAADKQK